MPDMIRCPGCLTNTVPAPEQTTSACRIVYVCGSCMAGGLQNQGGG